MSERDCQHVGTVVTRHDCAYCDRDLMRPVVHAALDWMTAENSWKASMAKYLLMVACRKFLQRSGR